MVNENVPLAKEKPDITDYKKQEEAGGCEGVNIHIP